jgi:hypothetical protein
MPYIVLKVDEQEKAVEVLTTAGINVINKEEIYAK